MAGWAGGGMGGARMARMHGKAAASAAGGGTGHGRGGFVAMASSYRLGVRVRAGAGFLSLGGTPLYTPGHQGQIIDQIFARFFLRSKI